MTHGLKRALRWAWRLLHHRRMGRQWEVAGHAGVHRNGL